MAVRTTLDSWLLAIYAALLLVALVILYPIMQVVVVSLTPIAELASRGERGLLSLRFSLAAYRYAFGQLGIGRSYLFTIARTVIGTGVNLALTSTAAYVLARRNLPLRRVLTGFVLVSIIFHGGLIPLFLVVKNLGLMNTLWALVLPTGINTFFLLIMRNFFRSVPESLLESARIDGCGEARTMLQIVFPLSSAVFATIGLFYAVFHWNEFFHAIIFITDAEKLPLQVLIRRMYQGAGDTLYLTDDTVPPPTESMRAATIVVTTIPILCLYPFLQRYFVKGALVGAVKG